MRGRDNRRFATRDRACPGLERIVLRRIATNHRLDRAVSEFGRVNLGVDIVSRRLSRERRNRINLHREVEVGVAGDDRAKRLNIPRTFAEVRNLIRRELRAGLNIRQRLLSDSNRVGRERDRVGRRRRLDGLIGYGHRKRYCLLVDAECINGIVVGNAVPIAAETDAVSEIEPKPAFIGSGEAVTCGGDFILADECLLGHEILSHRVGKEELDERLIIAANDGKVRSLARDRRRGNSRERFQFKIAGIGRLDRVIRCVRRHFHLFNGENHSGYINLTADNLELGRFEECIIANRERELFVGVSRRAANRHRAGNIRRERADLDERRIRRVDLLAICILIVVIVLQVRDCRFKILLHRCRRHKRLLDRERVGVITRLLIELGRDQIAFAVVDLKRTIQSNDLALASDGDTAADIKVVGLNQASDFASENHHARLRV